MPGKIIETVEQIQNVAMLTKKQLIYIIQPGLLSSELKDFKALKSCLMPVSTIVLNELEILIFISLPLLRNAFSNYIRTNCTFSLFKGH